MTTRQSVPEAMTSRRRTGVLFAMCLALVLVVGSVSGVNLVLPHVAVAIGASATQLTWIADAYTVALAAVAFGAAALLAPNTADPHPARVDTVGSVLSGVGIGGLVFGIIEGAERGWLNPLSVGAFTIAALGLVGWTMWSLRVKHPLLDPRLFRLRGFATGS